MPAKWIKAWGRRSEKRRLREGEAFEDRRDGDVVDDEDEAAAMVVIGPIGEPFRREHRVLRRLDDRRLARTVGEFDEALDPQQIVAAVLRQPAEGAGEIKPADRPVEGDGEGGDAVAVGVMGQAWLVIPAKAGIQGNCSVARPGPPPARG